MDGTLTELSNRWCDPFFRAYDHVKPEGDIKERNRVFERTLFSVMTTDESSSKMLKLKMFWQSCRDLNLSLLQMFRGARFMKKDPLAFKELVPIKGAKEIINSLHSKGYKLALVTSAGDDTVEIAKKNLSALNVFDAFITRNKVKRIKPYPDPILLACEQLGREPKECVMIGDFPADIEAGRAAGTKTVAVLGKHAKFTEENVRKQNPDFVVNALHELDQIFPGP